MKRITLFLVVMATTPNVIADEAQFFLGAGAALLAHEAGHEIVGGNNIEWNGPKWRCISECNASNIAAAGFVSQVVVSETIARVFDAPAQRSFRNGIRTFNTLQSLHYAIRNNHDLENFNDHNRRAARILLILFSAYSLYHIEF